MPHRANRSFVSNADALTAWTPIAVDVLRDTARTYHAIASVQQVAETVQSRSGIAADQPADVWMGRLLDRVAKETHRRGEAPLASLCPGPDDDERAALDRLACYRAHAVDLPADGGHPGAVRRATPTARSAPARARVERRRAPTAPSLRETTCTSCFMIVAVRENCSSCGAPLPG